MSVEHNLALSALGQAPPTREQSKEATRMMRDVLEGLTQTVQMAQANKALENLTEGLLGGGNRAATNPLAGLKDLGIDVQEQMKMAREDARFERERSDEFLTTLVKMASERGGGSNGMGMESLLAFVKIFQDMGQASNQQLRDFYERLDQEREKRLQSNQQQGGTFQDQLMGFLGSVAKQALEERLAPSPQPAELVKHYVTEFRELASLMGMNQQRDSAADDKRDERRFQLEVQKLEKEAELRRQELAEQREDRKEAQAHQMSILNSLNQTVGQLIPFLSQLVERPNGNGHSTGAPANGKGQGPVVDTEAYICEECGQEFWMPRGVEASACPRCGTIYDAGDTSGSEGPAPDGATAAPRGLDV